MDYYIFLFIKLSLGFLIIITHLKFSGKTQLEQMTPVDLMGNFILGGMIGGVCYNMHVGLLQYIATLLIGIFLISFLNYLTKASSVFKKVLIGQPIPIIKKRRFLMDNLHKHQIDLTRVGAGLRSQGVYSFTEIYYAQVEPSGQITVITEKNMPASILVNRGKIQSYELKEEIEKDEEWLTEMMKERGIDHLEEIFLAEFWHGNIKFFMNDGRVL